MLQFICLLIYIFNNIDKILEPFIYYINMDANSRHIYMETFNSKLKLGP